MQTSGNNFFLQWKGKVIGPFSVDEIREKLDSHEIGLLHTVRDSAGATCSVEDFLEVLQARERTDQQARVEQERARAAAEEQSRQQESQRRATGETTISSQLPSPSYFQQATQPPPPPQGHGTHQPATSGHRRISGMAVATFTLALLNIGFAVEYMIVRAGNAAPLFPAQLTWVFGVMFISALMLWIVTLVCGHITLPRLYREPGLQGRGITLAALLSTYCLLAVAVVMGLVYLSGKNY